jgi:hypothetical protein
LSLVLSRITEVTMPIGVDIGFGRLGSLALSGGYVNVKLVSANSALSDQSMSGFLDTEARFSVNLIPGKLMLLVTGAAPTGTGKTVQLEQLAILGAVSSDLIGFSAPNLGTGGNVGAGFVGAVPVGRMALGFGATYKMPLSYVPVVSAQSLQPGGEFRLRGGLEGALGSRTYLRVAGIVARSSEDKLGGTLAEGIGTRGIGYISVNQGVGRASITAYGFDVLRGDPRVELSTVTGVPSGNLIAGGLRADLSAAPRTTISPRLEYRISALKQVNNTGSTSLQRLGSSFRYGVDVRHTLSRSFAAVLQVGGLTGKVYQSSIGYPVSGLRAALQLDYTP